MAPKRPSSPEFIANPFIKKRNLDWTLQATAAQEAEAGESHNLGIDSQVSPTAAGNNQAEESKPESQSAAISKPTTAAVESGAASTDDHLAFFASSLRSRILTRSSGDEPDPLLSISSYEELYRAHAGSTEGAHFVIHQHDHPVAGTHYDLRLQINETSSVSWAIMYGLPGDPNSVRLNRNATETRIHCLWVRNTCLSGHAFQTDQIVEPPHRNCFSRDWLPTHLGHGHILYSPSPVQVCPCRGPFFTTRFTRRPIICTLTAGSSARSVPAPQDTSPATWLQVTRPLRAQLAPHQE